MPLRKMFVRQMICLLLTVACLLTAAAQRPRTGIRPQTNDRRVQTGIAFYDVDKIYDTLPALFYDDEEYTPEGRRHWDTERYRRKIRNTAAVIDSMALEIVALWGVENEAVVRNLVAACRGDYTYIHRTLNTLDGMDFALLYYGDRFFPHYVEPGRRYLYIEGTLGRDTVGLVLCAENRMAEWVVRDLRDRRPGSSSWDAAPRWIPPVTDCTTPRPAPNIADEEPYTAGAAGQCATAFWWTPVWRRSRQMFSHAVF